MPVTTLPMRDREQYRYSFTKQPSCRSLAKGVVNRIVLWAFAVLMLCVVSLGAVSVTVAAANAETLVPESARSKRVIDKIAPELADNLKAHGLTLGAPVMIRIFKDSRELEVWMKAPKSEQYVRYRSYPICYFSGKIGPKTKQGDRQAPEGFYQITPEQLNPVSQYHLSFDMGYPNRYDRYHGRTGSHLMVHGDCVSAGCFAMTNQRMEEIYTLVDAAFRHGQTAISVNSYPFRMEQANLRRHKNSPWYPFWLSMKKAYDRFEATKIPPSVSVSGGKYVVG